MKGEECCPRLNPKLWDNKIFHWKNKRFIKGHVFTLFFMPVNFGSVMTKMMRKVENAKAKTPDYLCLSDHTSKFNMDIYLAVDRKIEGAENVAISGKFFSKVYEGPFQETGKWCEHFKDFTQAKGMEIEKWYMWYTTCPKCAKKYGKNYVVIIAKVK